MERVKLEPFRPAPAAYSFGGYTLDPARGVLATPKAGRPDCGRRALRFCATSLRRQAGWSPARS
jgi:hypothetical protein